MKFSFLLAACFSCFFATAQECKLWPNKIGEETMYHNPFRGPNTINLFKTFKKSGAISYEAYLVIQTSDSIADENYGTVNITFEDGTVLQYDAQKIKAFLTPKHGYCYIVSMLEDGKWLDMFISRKILSYSVGKNVRTVEDGDEYRKQFQCVVAKAN